MKGTTHSPVRADSKKYINTSYDNKRKIYANWCNGIMYNTRLPSVMFCSINNYRGEHLEVTDNNSNFTSSARSIANGELDNI